MKRVGHKAAGNSFLHFGDFRTALQHLHMDVEGERLGDCWGALMMMTREQTFRVNNHDARAHSRASSLRQLKGGGPSRRDTLDAAGLR